MGDFVGFLYVGSPQLQHARALMLHALVWFAAGVPPP